MCQYSPKLYQACGHTGSRTDLVVTVYCGPSVSGQWCERGIAGTFPAPGLCPPCQNRMAGLLVDTSYYTRELQDDSNPEAFVQLHEIDGPISPQLMQQSSQWKAMNKARKMKSKEALRIKLARRSMGAGMS